jgi:hypothetical protein
MLVGVCHERVEKEGKQVQVTQGEVAFELAFG